MGYLPNYIRLHTLNFSKQLLQNIVHRFFIDEMFLEVLEVPPMQVIL